MKKSKPSLWEVSVDSERERFPCKQKRKKTLEACSNRSCRVSAVPSTSGSVTTAHQTPSCALQATRRHPVAIQIPTNFPQLLQSSQRSQGWAALWRWCSLQLLHARCSLLLMWSKAGKVLQFPQITPREARAVGCGCGRLLPAFSCTTTFLPQPKPSVGSKDNPDIPQENQRFLHTECVPQPAARPCPSAGWHSCPCSVTVLYLQSFVPPAPSYSPTAPRASGASLSHSYTLNSLLIPAVAGRALPTSFDRSWQSCAPTFQLKTWSWASSLALLVQQTQPLRPMQTPCEGGRREAVQAHTNSAGSPHSSLLPLQLTLPMLLSLLSCCVLIQEGGKKRRKKISSDQKQKEPSKGKCFLLQH